LKYLLDTNALIWYLSGSNKITDEVLETIKSNKNQVYFSLVNIIEISIKISIGKLRMPQGYLNFLLNSSFKEISLNSKHAYELQVLPFVHKDTFDRLLIVQATIENLTIITSDEIFKKYGIEILLLN